MLSLLIADDEKVIRESLAECLNWEEIGIRVVGCCANGLEALDITIDESPDIVMTDIKMPGLNGLELIEKIQATNQDTEFIILSGYREFDFAKKAMEFGVRRYLLKPVGETQLRDAVLDAARSFERRSSVKAAMKEHQQLQLQMGAYYRQQLQYALFLHGGALEQAAKVYLERFPGQGDHFANVSFTPLRLEEAHRLTRLLTPKLAELGFVTVTDFLFGKDTLYAILRSRLPEAIAAFVQRAGELTPAAGIEVHDGISLEGCVQRLHLDLARYSHVYTVDADGGSYELYGSGLSLEAMQQLPEQLLLLGDESDRHKAEAQIRAYLNAIEELHTLRAAGAHLVAGILVHRQFPGSGEHEYEGIFDEIYKEGERGPLVDKVVLTVLSLLWEDHSGNDLIQKVKRHVRHNLADSTLSLKQIATQHAHVNVDYLSRLFVQETGEKFSHYLNGMRVEKAKQLLQADSSKVYQVAEQVGLGHNPRYFGQVFKKYTGMTPSAFAEKQGGG